MAVVKKEELEKRILDLKKKFKGTKSIDWNTAISGNSEVLVALSKNLVREDMKAKSIDKSEAIKRFGNMFGDIQSEESFIATFKKLTGKESMRVTAAKTGWSASQIHKFKTGKANPSVSDLVLIAEVYKKDPSIFLEYRIYMILFSIEHFLIEHGDIATAWFDKVAKG